MVTSKTDNKFNKITNALTMLNEVVTIMRVMPTMTLGPVSAANAWRSHELIGPSEEDRVT